MLLDTVKIKHPGGYAVINKADFDPKAHKLYEEPPELTRESVAEMKKADLVELLAAHEAPTEGTVDELRERALNVVFI